MVVVQASSLLGSSPRWRLPHPVLVIGKRSSKEKVEVRKYRLVVGALSTCTKHVQAHELPDSSQPPLNQCWGACKQWRQHETLARPTPKPDFSPFLSTVCSRSQ